MPPGEYKRHPLRVRINDFKSTGETQEREEASTVGLWMGDPAVCGQGRLSRGSRTAAGFKVSA